MPRPDFPRQPNQSLADYWQALQRFAKAEGYSDSFLRPMALTLAVAENGTEITVRGPASVLSDGEPGIGFWLAHQVPIFTGKRARLEVA